MELLVFCTMLGSTVALGDDFLELFVFSAMLGLTVAPGDDFVKMFVFSALLGSTLDFLCSSRCVPSLVGRSRMRVILAFWTRRSVVVACS